VFAEEIINQGGAVVSPNKNTVGHRSQNPWIFMMKRVESWAKKEKNLILRFMSSIMTEIADYYS
jgi:hypothetical protein